MVLALNNPDLFEKHPSLQDQFFRSIASEQNRVFDLASVVSARSQLYATDAFERLPPVVEGTVHNPIRILNAIYAARLGDAGMQGRSGAVSAMSAWRGLPLAPRVSDDEELGVAMLDAHAYAMIASAVAASRPVIVEFGAGDTPYGIQLAAENPEASVFSIEPNVDYFDWRTLGNPEVPENFHFLGGTVEGLLPLALLGPFADRIVTVAPRADSMPLFVLAGLAMLRPGGVLEMFTEDRKSIAEAGDVQSLGVSVDSRKLSPALARSIPSQYLEFLGPEVYRLRARLSDDLRARFRFDRGERSVARRTMLSTMPYAMEAERRGIRVEINLPSDLHYREVIDDEAIDRFFEMFFETAIDRATDRGGAIRIGWEEGAFTMEAKGLFSQLSAEQFRMLTLAWDYNQHIQAQYAQPSSRDIPFLRWTSVFSADADHSVRFRITPRDGDVQIDRPTNGLAAVEAFERQLDEIDKQVTQRQQEVFDQLHGKPLTEEAFRTVYRPLVDEGEEYLAAIWQQQEELTARAKREGWPTEAIERVGSGYHDYTMMWHNPIQWGELYALRLQNGGEYRFDLASFGKARTLGDTAYSARRAFEEIASKDGLEIDVGDLPAEIDEAIPTREAWRHFRRILYNLLSNSSKYYNPSVPEGERWARVRFSLEGGSLQIEASDNGRGMSADMLKRFGEQGWRDPAVVAEGIEGTGTGSGSIIASVKRLGGTFAVESELGKGSSFHIALPLEGLLGAEKAAKIKASTPVVRIMRNDGKGDREDPAYSVHPASPETLKRLQNNYANYSEIKPIMRYPFFVDIENGTILMAQYGLFKEDTGEFQKGLSSHAKILEQIKRDGGRDLDRIVISQYIQENDGGGMLMLTRGQYGGEGIAPPVFAEAIALVARMCGQRNGHVLLGEEMTTFAFEGAHTGRPRWNDFEEISYGDELLDMLWDGGIRVNEDGSSESFSLSHPPTLIDAAFDVTDIAPADLDPFLEEDAHLMGSDLMAGAHLFAAAPFVMPVPML